MNILNAIKLSMRRRDGKGWKVRRKESRGAELACGPSDNWVSAFRASDLTATDWVAVVPKRAKLDTLSALWTRPEGEPVKIGDIMWFWSDVDLRPLQATLVRAERISILGEVRGSMWLVESTDGLLYDRFDDDLFAKPVQCVDYNLYLLGRDADYADRCAEDAIAEAAHAQAALDKARGNVREQ